jgi:protein NRD1
VLGQATNASIVQNGSASTLTTQISPDELSSKSGGLDAFDFASFNPMLPASWVALGKAFEVSNGYTPSQEELMMMISGGMMAFAQMQGVGGMGGTGMNGMQTEQGMNGGQWGDSGQEWNTVGGRGRGSQHRGRSGFRGRGGGGLDGGYQYQQQQWGSNTGYNGSTYGHAAQETDAVVLGGASDAQSDGYCDAAGAGDDGPQSADDTEALGTGGTGGTGGSMRKVGDKWIFVRNSDNGSS